MRTRCERVRTFSRSTASTRGSPSASDSRGLRRFRGRRDPVVPRVPRLGPDGRGRHSSPSEGLKKRPASVGLATYGSAAPPERWMHPLSTSGGRLPRSGSSRPPIAAPTSPSVPSGAPTAFRTQSPTARPRPNSRGTQPSTRSPAPYPHARGTGCEHCSTGTSSIVAAWTAFGPAGGARRRGCGFGTSIRAHLAAELLVEGERWPVFVWTIDHPAGPVLVDTGMIDSRPEIDDMSPTPHPENIPRDVACVINTHLHFDHCGGNRLFPGVPIHVQARELADARSLDDYTIREWVDFDGATYVEHEGEVELLPGIRLLPAPGHTDGIRWSSSRPTRARTFSEATWAPVPRARQRHDRGTASRARAGAPTWLSHAAGPKIPEHRCDHARHGRQTPMRQCMESSEGSTSTPRVAMCCTRPALGEVRRRRDASQGRTRRIGEATQEGGARARVRRRGCLTFRIRMTRRPVGLAMPSVLSLHRA